MDAVSRPLISNESNASWTRTSHWYRTKLSWELCIDWDWKALNGQYKDMACRGLLLKLEKLGLITLPPRRTQANNSLRNRLVHPIQHQQSPIHASLKTLVPLHIERVQKDEHKTLFLTLLALYHYLGYCRTAGKNVKYIVFDRNANPLVLKQARFFEIRVLPEQRAF